jgi:hypothetical protein
MLITFAEGGVPDRPRDALIPPLVVPQFYLWSTRIWEDWHKITLSSGDGERIEFCCYGDLTGHWPDRWEFTCSRAQDGTEQKLSTSE